MFGILSFLSRKLLTTFLICVFITFCPSIPPNATYIPYGHLLKLPRNLTPDINLNNAERILEGQLVGAEAFAVHKGSLYSGLHGGHVVKILPHKILPIVKTGKDCAGIHQEHICGRPLGLRIKDDTMYIADSYFGIFTHNILEGPGNLKQVLGPDVQVNGKPVKIFNCVEVDNNGMIYFSSSSSEFDINEGLHSLLASGTGRVLKFDPKTKKVTQLIDGLNFANGIALSSDEDYLLVAETVARRVLKYNLKTGSVQTILEGLPGLPDNIQHAGGNTFFASLVTPSDDEYPGITEILADWPNIRKFLGRFLFLIELPFKLIDQYFPNSFCEKAAHQIGHLAPVIAILPDKVTIVRFDGNTGKILDVLHGNNGIVKVISDVAVVGDHMYFGSPANNFVGRFPLMGELKGRFAQTEEAAKSTAGSGAQARKAAEEAKAKKAAEEAKKAAEEAKAKKAAEEAKAKKAAEEAKAKKAAEEAKKVAEEAKAKKVAEEAKAKKVAEEAKKAAEEAKAKKAAEEAKAKKAAEEAKAKKAAEEANKAKSKQAEANKKISEEEIKTNKISDDAGKSKVHGDKVKTEL